MRRTMGVVIVLFLLAIAVPATAAMYNISVAPEGDRVFYRSWWYGGNDRGWDPGANPNTVSHSYSPGDGRSMETALSFDLSSIRGTVQEIVSASFNYNILSIWTEGRDDVANLNSFWTVYASNGTGWKSFNVTEALRAALAGTATTADFYFSYTGYSGFTFSSAEGGMPAFLTITTAEASPVPIPPAVWLFAPALAGLVGLRRRFKR